MSINLILMNRLNYKHLRYFFEAARGGGVMRAAERLHVSPQAVSAQIRQLEDQLGHQLFQREGRALRLTQAGPVAQQYAERIFASGDELHAVLSDHPGELALPLKIGITDSVPKAMAARCLLPFIEHAPERELNLHEGPLDRLIERLVTGKLRWVLTDLEPPPMPGVALSSQLIVRSGFTVVGAQSLLDEIGTDFPACLDTAPMLLWETTSNLTGALRAWFEAANVAPRVVARCVDSALMKRLASDGAGLAPVPTVVLDEVRQQHGLLPLGAIDDVDMSLWCVGLEASDNTARPTWPNG